MFPAENWLRAFGLVVAERRLILSRAFKRRSATPTRWTRVFRGLKATAAFRASLREARPATSMTHWKRQETCLQDHGNDD